MNLLQKLHQGPKRRQSPLVNAGYAARMAVMTYILESWVDEAVREWQAEASNERVNVNVVMVGCGMDALGIWSKHILDHSLRKAFESKTTDVDIKMNVYEYDSWDNCILKKEYLLKSGLLILDPAHEYHGHENHQRNTQQPSDEDSHVHVRGCINLNTSKSNGKDNDYTLVSLDLRYIHENKSILSDATRHSGLDQSQPTIVLSELVLAYLGYNGANAVLQSISDIINGNQLSMFACLEPMFPTDDEHITSLDSMSVEESYARDYSRQFLGKLQTGNVGSHSECPNENDAWLHPLGSNIQTIHSRLATCGLSNSSCATLLECTACVAQIFRGTSSTLCSPSMGVIGPTFMFAKEPFDEHAALALNLKCYCVICSFHPSPSDKNAPKLNERICPWSKMPHKPRQTALIKPIASSVEDAQVNALYGRLYLQLYNKFPAIRKMVKSALKGDLSLVQGSMHSVIRGRFVNDDGDFWVATTKTSSRNTKDQSDHVVIGCIGIKQRRNGNVRGKDNTKGSTEYEIYRFAVDDSYRGLGVGNQLLQVAEETSSRKGATDLYAVTPSCLEAANNLYQTRGYSMDDSKCFMAGELRMHVYVKQCNVSQP